MREEWPTKEYDLMAAAKIIQKYFESNDGMVVGLIDIEVDEEDNAEFKLSDWLMELAEHFYVQYGREQGDYVTKMVVSNCITQGQTIH